MGLVHVCKRMGLIIKIGKAKVSFYYYNSCKFTIFLTNGCPDLCVCVCKEVNLMSIRFPPICSSTQFSDNCIDEHSSVSLRVVCMGAKPSYSHAYAAIAI